MKQQNECRPGDDNICGARTINAASSFFVDGGVSRITVNMSAFRAGAL
jgi:hypothetical protein